MIWRARSVSVALSQSKNTRYERAGAGAGAASATGATSTGAATLKGERTPNRKLVLPWLPSLLVVGTTPLALTTVPPNFSPLVACVRRYSLVSDRPGTFGLGNERPAITCQAKAPCVPPVVKLNGGEGEVAETPFRFVH